MTVGVPSEKPARLPETDKMTVKESNLSRREMLLMSSGVAMLCLGKFADSAVNGAGPADQQRLDAAVARLDRIPSAIGSWTSRDLELSQREIDVAGIRGYIRREFHSDKSGYTVFLTVLCGNAGPMSVHPPTACFQGVGYKLASGPVVTTLRSDESKDVHEFNKSAFRQQDASVPEVVRVFWAWSSSGIWQAPSNPRFAFRGDSWLYKIYVTDSSLEDPGQPSLPQVETFLQDALPILANALSGVEAE